MPLETFRRDAWSLVNWHWTSCEGLMCSPLEGWASRRPWMNFWRWLALRSARGKDMFSLYALKGMVLPTLFCWFRQGLPILLGSSTDVINFHLRFLWSMVHSGKTPTTYIWSKWWNTKIIHKPKAKNLRKVCVPLCTSSSPFIPSSLQAPHCPKGWHSPSLFGGMQKTKKINCIFEANITQLTPKIRKKNFNSASQSSKTWSTDSSPSFQMQHQ